jgi:hypothetical protein
VLIDHVGNTQREYNVSGLKYSGLPEGFNSWGLDRRQKRKAGQGDAIPVRICMECFQPYERIYDCCPYCGAAAPPPAERGGPEFVDGKLHLLDPMVVAQMRLAVIQRDQLHPSIPQGASPLVVRGIQNRHHAGQQAQAALRSAMAAWAGWHLGTQSENESRFFHRYGVDVLTAQALAATEANALAERINNDLQELMK